MCVCVVLQSRMLPAWAIEMKYFDKTTGETLTYHDLCPKTPMIFFNHYWDGIPNSPEWPLSKPLYLMPNIEMYELQAKHYWGVDVVLCKTAICARRVRMWYEQEGNPRNTKVIYTRHTSSDVATFAKNQLGADAIEPKNFSDVQFIHAVGTRYAATLRKLRLFAGGILTETDRACLLYVLLAVFKRAHGSYWTAGSSDPASQSSPFTCIQTCTRTK